MAANPPWRNAGRASWYISNLSPSKDQFKDPWSLNTGTVPSSVTVRSGS